ncbi:MAG: hypothetical protein ACJ8G3_11550, partial [Burkholderiaceae bacterium]
NCCVEGSLLLMNPHLGNNVFFGPDVVVEANVTIGSNVLFRGGNWIKAGSVIGDGAVIERRVNVSGTIAPGALVPNERAPELSGLPPGAAPAAPGSHMRSPVGMAPAGTELQAAGMPGAGKPRQAKPIKVLDLTGEDEVDAIPDLPSSAPRADRPQATSLDRSYPTASRQPSLQLLAMGNSNYLAPAPSLPSLSLRPLPSARQPFFSLPPPTTVPPSLGALSPPLASDSVADMAKYGLVITAPPTPLQHQGPIYGQPPGEQGPAALRNAPGINTHTDLPLLYPQPFSSFVTRKPLS